LKTKTKTKESKEKVRYIEPKKREISSVLSEIQYLKGNFK
jgi:hypothetical protein